MKLSKKDKMELRKSVEVLLNASPDNKKIQLSNETLDQLLFDTYVVNKEKGIKVKLPVWSGDFLRKLDLSRVSFEDVSWAMLDDGPGWEGYCFNYPIDEDFIDRVEKGKIDFGVHVDENNPICYANTNARIDFSKSFDAKYGQEVNIYSCDFSNVDLSNNILDTLDRGINVVNSDLTNTNIRFPNEILQYISSSNLTNLDLSNIEIDAVRVLYGDKFNGTDLSNTGARIILDLGKLKELVTSVPQLGYEYYQKILKGYMEGCWVGCYLNGKLIKSPEEKRQSAETTREEYEQYKSQEFTNILGSIEEQMDSSEPTK